MAFKRSPFLAAATVPGECRPCMGGGALVPSDPGRAEYRVDSTKAGPAADGGISQERPQLAATRSYGVDLDTLLTSDLFSRLHRCERGSGVCGVPHAQWHGSPISIEEGKCLELTAARRLRTIR